MVYFSMTWALRIETIQTTLLTSFHFSWNVVVNEILIVTTFFALFVENSCITIALVQHQNLMLLPQRVLFPQILTMCLFSSYPPFLWNQFISQNNHLFATAKTNRCWCYIKKYLVFKNIQLIRLCGSDIIRTATI